MDPKPTRLTESTELIEESYPVNQQFNLVQNDQMSQYYQSQITHQPKYPTFGDDRPVHTGYGNQMTQGVLPRVTNYVQGTYSFTDVSKRQITLNLPSCISGLYDRLMERRRPKDPVITRCPHCNIEITTEMKSKFGLGTAGCTLGLCMCCPQIFWVPLITDECYDHEHRCPQCKQALIKDKFMC